MIADYGDGGQKLLDIMAFNKSLKIAWIVKYISDDCKSKWEIFWDFFLSKWGGKLVFLGNLKNKRRSVTKTFCGRVHRFFVSIHLIPALHVLDIYESLAFRGKKDDIFVSHCLLLAKYYIYCCKFKNISPSIREYAQQLKYNSEIEKQSIVTDSQTKYFIHYNCYTVCGRAPNVSLLAGHILFSLC